MGNLRLTYSDADNNFMIDDSQSYRDGFETQSGWAAHWTSLTGYDSSFKHSGNYWGKVVNTSTTEKTIHTDYWMPINNSAATQYDYSVWVYSDGPSAELFLFMKKENETGYYTYYTQVATTVTGQWVHLTGSYWVPADVRSLSVRLDNNSQGTVWFDDVSIKKHTINSEITEYTDYYPFGLKHNIPASNTVATTNPAQKYKYNGKELTDALALNTYDFGARNYDPALGRWMNIDPKAEQSRRWTPYNYTYNNPMYFVDPDGMQADDWRNKNGQLVYDTTANGGKGAYTEHATQDDRKLGKALQQTPTGRQQFDKLVNSETPTMVSIDKVNAPTDENGGLILGETFPSSGGYVKVTEKDSSGNISNVEVKGFEITIYEKNVTETINENASQQMYGYGKALPKEINFSQLMGVTIGHEIEHADVEDIVFRINNPNN